MGQSQPSLYSICPFTTAFAGALGEKALWGVFPFIFAYFLLLLQKPDTCFSHVGSTLLTTRSRIKPDQPKTKKAKDPHQVREKSPETLLPTKSAPMY